MKHPNKPFNTQSDTEDCETVDRSSDKVKLAGDEREALDPLLDPDDSGIDSDGDRRRRQLAIEGSSDDDYDYRLGSPGREILKERGDSITLEQWSLKVMGEKSPDRGSPLLYEVELTASDEDDDTSVFELVIPVPNRYKRVNSTPMTNKGMLIFFCSFFCCFRKCF